MYFGERIRLRAIEREDLPRFVGWVNDPEVRCFLDMIFPLSAEDEEDWYANARKLPPVEKPFAIDVKDGDGWRLVGSCGFIHVDQLNRHAEVGISIGDKEEWGKGYGTEIMRLLVKIGFDTFNLHRIYLRVFENNQRGIRAYEKVGFVLEGRLREAFYREGSYQDMLIMGVLKSEWLARKEKGV